MSASQRSNRGPAAAVENRAAIIRAAGEVFAEQGLDAPLNAIAKRAGVGQGSLYRHFRTRESLAIVAFEANLAQIEGVVAAGGTLDDVLRMVSDQAARSSAFLQLIVRHPDDPQVAELGSRIRGVVAATIDDGRMAGTVPATFEVDDLLLAIRLLAGALAGSVPAERTQLVERGWLLLGIHLN